MLKVGARVQVNDRITAGVGTAPKRGARGTVEQKRSNGTVLVKLDDGRRALLASWEVELVKDQN